MNSILKKVKIKQLLLIFIILAVPSSYILINLKLNGTNLWFDPARDLLSAWDSLTKPTLLGPPTGIPGLFYGPYWIWLLSFGLLFSKNPVIITIITATIPYLIIFPLIWFQLSKKLDRTALILGWLLFIMGNGMTYATQLWNLYPAPLITIATLVTLILTDFSKLNKKSILTTFITGFLLSLVVNFDTSFGITLLLSVFIFLIVDMIIDLLNNKTKQKVSKRLLLIGSIGIGLIVGFLPIIFFESRHNFLQIHTLLYTLSRYGWVIGVLGLSKSAILDEYFKTFGHILHTNAITAEIVLILLLLVLIYKIIRRKLKNYQDVRIGLLSVIILLGSAFIYFTVKNPIWEYHFISIDVIFLLFITYAASKIPLFKKLLFVWTIFIIVINFYQLANNSHEKITGFEQQIAVVKTINQDANGSDYSIYAYSASIYIYNYTYLFKWLLNKNIPYDPSLVKRGNLVYLIVPSKEDAFIKDFIHNRAPEKEYAVSKTWRIENTIVIKEKKR